MTQPLISREQINKLIQNLISFLKHPRDEISKLPDWSWTELLLVHVLITATTGALSGLVSKSFLSLISGIILSPILTLITLSISALFFYYFFQIFARVTLPFRKLMTLILLANLPFFIFQIVAVLVPPMILVGLAFTAVLLVIGLIANFSLDKKLVVQTMMGIYALLFVVWIWGRWDGLQLETGWKNSSGLNAPEVRLGE